MKIYLAIDIPTIKTKEDGLAWGQSLAEHIVDTFNDDNSIKTVSYQVRLPRKGTT